MAINDVVIVSNARTAIGSFRGSLSQLSATELGSAAIKGAIEKSGISQSDVQEVFMGCVLQAHLGQSPARQASIGAGIPVSTPCTTVNKVCASGLKAVLLATQTLMLGHQDVIVAGGMESLSNVPFYLQRGEIPYGGIDLKDGIQYDGLTDAYGNGNMGDCSEGVAKKFNISRQDQDEYAILSYKRSIAAAESGFIQKEIVPVTIPGKRGPDITVNTDEEYLSPNVNFDRMPSLKPAFQKDGTITAANASALCDGAAACVLTTEAYAKSKGLKPQARILAISDAAIDPQDFPVAPSQAIPKVLKRAGLEKDDIDLWEINEAFSVVPLANIKILNLDLSKVNKYGGAVGMGHPLGMSGARVVNRMVHALETGQKGVATACNGGGGASAIVLEKL